MTHHRRHVFPIRLVACRSKRPECGDGVYVAAFDSIGAIKIGWASVPNERLRTLETPGIGAGKCRAMILLAGATKKTERGLHRALAAFQFGSGRGAEWFKPSPAFFRALLMLVASEISGHLKMPTKRKRLPTPNEATP